MKEVRLDLSGAPSGVEEVLVVLDGEHQPIPTGVPAEEKMAKPLPPPPPDDKVTSGAQPGAAQTEADKLVQKYQQLGKEQDHVYGAMYSNMPDFASKPTPKAPAPPPGVAVTPTANRSTTPLGSGPVLGSPLQPAAPGPIPRSTAASAQSQSPAPAVKPPAAHAPGSKPALPLGSPRPKSTADGNTHGASQTTPPANTSTKPPANPPQ
jgi:hypothetical protein